MKSTTKAIVVLLALVLYGKSASLARAGNEATELPGEDRLFEAIRLDEAVVLGSVSSVAPDVDGSRSLHQGTVVLDVHNWLRGSGKSRLTLPYVYEREGVPLKARLLYAWPPVEALHAGQCLVCVFKLGAKERFAMPAADTDGAASLVWVVSGDSDRIVSAIKGVIALNSERDAAGWTQKLAKGLNASDSLVRQYCLDAVYHDIGREDPPSATSLLTDHLDHADQIRAGPIETSATLGHVMAMASSTKDPAVVVKAIHSMGLAATAPENPRWLQSSAVQLLGQLLNQPGVPSATKVFNERERGDIRARLQLPARPTNPFEDKQRAAILKWLVKTNH